MTVSSHPHSRPPLDGRDPAPGNRSLRIRIFAALLMTLTCIPGVARAVVPGSEDDPLWRLPFTPVRAGVGWEDGVIYGLEWPVKLRGRVGATVDVEVTRIGATGKPPTKAA